MIDYRAKTIRRQNESIINRSFVFFGSHILKGLVEKNIETVVEWHNGYLAGQTVYNLTVQQIQEFYEINRGAE